MTMRMREGKPCKWCKAYIRTGQCPFAKSSYCNEDFQHHLMSGVLPDFTKMMTVEFALDVLRAHGYAGELRKVDVLPV